VLGGEVGVGRVDVAGPEHRPGQFDLLRVDLDRGECRVPQHAAAVGRVVQQRAAAGPAGAGRDRGDLGADRGLGRLGRRRVHRHGVLGHGVLGHGVLGHGVLGHGVLGHGVLGHGVLGHGANVTS
jgi:hypothetical protein